MRDISELPMEFKTSKKTDADGLYIIPHPWIKNYFFECKVAGEEGITKLVTIKKEKVKVVDRNCTFTELSNIREAFYSDEEYVVQFVSTAHISSLSPDGALHNTSTLTKLNTL